MKPMKNPMLECSPTMENSSKATPGALSPSNEQLQIGSTAYSCVITHRQRALPVANHSSESMEPTCAPSFKGSSSQQLRQMQKDSYFLSHSALSNLKISKTRFGSLNNYVQSSWNMFLPFLSKKTRWFSCQIVPKAFSKVC